MCSYKILPEHVNWVHTQLLYIYSDLVYKNIPVALLWQCNTFMYYVRYIYMYVCMYVYIYIYTRYIQQQLELLCTSRMYYVQVPCTQYLVRVHSTSYIVHRTSYIVQGTSTMYLVLCTQDITKDGQERNYGVILLRSSMYYMRTATKMYKVPL